jgi:isopenicillin N synthase-like dioxygenase
MPHPPETAPTLPILSLPSLSTPEGLALLSQACEETGFFHLTDHGIPTSQLSNLLNLTRTFFQTAPSSEKERLARGNGGDMARGYQMIGENITLGKQDFHEAIDLYAPWNEESMLLRENTALIEEANGVVTGTNLWPDTPRNLKEELEDYISQASKTGAQVVSAMSLALRLNDSEKQELESGMDNGFWVCRMIGYPPLGSRTDGGISCGEHTDYGALTLLLATPTSPPSLQVLHRSTNTWIPVTPIEGAFVVNIGDMMQHWTNGLWKSTLHRVIHTSDTFRVSVPFFYEPAFTTEVRPFETCMRKTRHELKRSNDESLRAVVYGRHLIGKVKGNFY